MGPVQERPQMPDPWRTDMLWYIIFFPQFYYVFNSYMLYRQITADMLSDRHVLAKDSGMLTL
jgi:hypothetical protein